MSCQTCKSERLVQISAHARDCFDAVFADGEEHSGYYPENIPLGCGDDMSFIFCLDCGQIQGNWPYVEDSDDL